MKKATITLLFLSTVSSTFANYDIDTILEAMERQFQESAQQLNQFFNSNKDSLNKGLANTKDATKEVANKIQSRISSYAPNSLLVKAHENTEKKEFRIETPVPGFKKGEVTATLEEHHNQAKLTIIAESKSESHEKKAIPRSGAVGAEVRSSFASSTLTRSFTLPSTVDTTSYKASHEDGVFTLVFPLKKEVTKKTIEIKLDDEKIKLDDEKEEK